MIFASLTFGLAALFSLVLPLSVVFMRDTVKRQRQGYIRILQNMFETRASALAPEQESPAAGIVAGLEFMKFKYFMGLYFPDSETSESRADVGDRRAASGSKKFDTKNFKQKGDSVYLWMLYSLPLILVLFVLTCVVASAILREVAPSHWGRSLLFSQERPPPPGASRESWIWILVVAFLGGYLAVLRSLVRAIHNFDLNPTSFVAASVHLLLGIATALVIAAAAEGVLEGNAGTWLTPTLVVVAFLVGFFPELGLRSLMRRTRLFLFKRDDPDVYRSFRATPVEALDGIDLEVRQRLSEYHIVAVQNLATANPIMLFVETPYSIYQIMDWTAQAQLCCSVGPKRLRELWKLGIRTIFDLERAVLTPAPEEALCRYKCKYTTPQLRQAVGRALSLDAGAALWSDDASIIADVEVRLDDPHVHRLRLIFLRVQEWLGDASRRLPPAACPCRPGDEAARAGAGWCDHAAGASPCGSS